MTSHHIRLILLGGGLATLLAAATSAADTPLLAAHTSGHVEHRRAAPEAVQIVRAPVSHWAKKEGVAEARDVEGAPPVVGNAVEIQRESDQAIAEQIGTQIRRVAMPGPHGSHVDADIERALHGHNASSFYGIFDYVAAGVEDGLVTLTGYVTHEYKAGKMEEVVSRVQGVREIENQIEVLQVSMFDNQLRAGIARQIYGNVLLPHVGIAAPLHIVVNDMHVTLAGTVFSEVEKRRAEHIARQIFGVLFLQNDLEVEPEERCEGENGTP